MSIVDLKYIRASQEGGDEIEVEKELLHNARWTASSVGILPIRGTSRNFGGGMFRGRKLHRKFRRKRVGQKEQHRQLRGG